MKKVIIQKGTHVDTFKANVAPQQGTKRCETAI